MIMNSKIEELFKIIKSPAIEIKKVKIGKIVRATLAVIISENSFHKLKSKIY
jgi:hypothetical protein